MIHLIGTPAFYKIAMNTPVLLIIDICIISNIPMRH